MHPTHAPIPGQAAFQSLVPFGLGQDKPHHFREMAEVIWENRDALPYAWNILNKGVCDGCSLGTSGLRDDVMEGPHLCLTRLRLLRLNTMPALRPNDISDINKLRKMDNEELHALGRLPYPFVYRPGDRGFSRISWDEALKLAGDALRPVPGPRQAWFATSRGITNETYYTFGKAARLSGTNNVDLCARLCHQASVAGLKATIGVGAPTISLKGWLDTDLIVLWGSDVANNQPVTMKYLAEAKDRGVRVVVVNPARELGLERYWVPSMPLSALFGSKIADDWLQVRVGGDLALVNGVLKLLEEEGRINQAYVDAHTTGWAEQRALLRSLQWEDLERDSGLPRAKIAWLAELYARAKDAISVWSMGITQHTFGTENVHALAALHLALGQLGRAGAGLVPIRGHSGVQGGGECGAGPNILPGHIPNSPENRALFEGHWGHTLPTHRGIPTVAMVQAMLRGDIDFLYSLGGNLLAVLPDPEGLRQAFAKVSFRIHQDIVINSSTVLEGAGPVLLLPAQTRDEQREGGTSTSTERRIRFSPEIPNHPQVGECRPEYEIPCQVAIAAFPDLQKALGYPGSKAIREEIGRIVPLYAGIEKLEKTGDSVQWGGEVLCVDGHFPNMPDEKARFIPAPPRRIEIPEGHFYLTTRRGKQFNSIVLKAEDHLHGGRSRDDIFVSSHDLPRLGLKEGAKIALISELGRFTGTLRAADLPSGNMQAYWPECNGVIATRCDPLSDEPDYNAVVQVVAL